MVDVALIEEILREQDNPGYVVLIVVAETTPLASLQVPRPRDKFVTCPIADRAAIPQFSIPTTTKNYNDRL